MAVSGVDASRRRMVYGANAIVQAMLAVVVVSAVIWLTGRFQWQRDLTRAGANSLSPRTRQLLKNLDQNIRITAVFPEPEKRDALGAKHRRQIRDLLDLYEAAGGARVSTRLLDPSLEKGETEKLLARLKELPAYKDEAKPHEAALLKFPDLNNRIEQLATGDFQKFKEAAKANPGLAKSQDFAAVGNGLGSITREAPNARDEVERARTGREIPQYGQALKQVRQYLTTVQGVFTQARDWMVRDAKSLPNLPPEMPEFFQSAPARYDAVLADVAALLDSTKDLKDVKLEELYTGLTRWAKSPPVLVEDEKEARILANYDVWRSADPGTPVGPDGDDKQFNGEAAVSSAILQLTAKDKTAVIFTRYGGESPIRPDFSQMNPMMMQMPRAPYQQLNDLLQKANFVTEDWDVSKQKTPPEVPGASRRIYVVFPPEPPPPQRNPMEPPPPGLTPEDRQAIQDAIGKSGMAIFLTGFAPPTSQMPGAVGNYEFADYLKSTWGVEVLCHYLTLQFVPNPQKPGWWVPAGRQPQLLTSGGDGPVRFTTHAIAAPARADAGAFFSICPLRPVTDETKPAGVKVEVLAEVRKTDDVWAVDDVRRLDEQWKRNQGFRRAEGDLPAPFPIAVAASNGDNQKVVVFASEQFASDALAQATGLQQVGQRYVLGVLYPANSDLFINALHWLTGDKDRIALGPRSGDMPRLSKLDETWSARLPWFLVGIWPALALLVGVGVWLVRRR